MPTLPPPPAGGAAGWDEGVPPGGEAAGPLDRWSEPTVLLVAAGVLLVVALVPWAIRSIVTFPLALLLPGHALLAALDRPDRSLSGGARVALRVVVSLAAISIVVLAVGAVFGVDRFSVLIGVWLFSTICGFIAWGYEVPTARAEGRHGWTQSGVLLAITGIIAVVVVAVGLAVLPEPRQEPFSSLGLAGTTKASGFPLRVRSGTTAELEVEVRNATDQRATYRVIGAIDGGAAWDAPEVVLDPGEREVVDLEGPIPADACIARLRISLSANREDAGVRPLIVYVRNEAGDACG
jgi:uncharacterized membrane protein